MEHPQTAVNEAPTNRPTNPNISEVLGRLKFPTVDDSDPDQQELSRILKSWNLPKDPTSIIHFGKNGVLRNLNGDRDVLDAIGLDPNMIRKYLMRYPEEWRQGYEGVDGTKIPVDLWYHPENELFPPPLSKEKQQEAWNEHNERKAREEEAKEVADSPLLSKERKEEAQKAYEEWRAMKLEEAQERQRRIREGLEDP
jgi:hypothetical protein